MLLVRIERFLRTYQIAPARFGREAVGDPCFVFELWNGRQPRKATAGRVVAYMQEAERCLQATFEPAEPDSEYHSGNRCRACSRALQGGPAKTS